MKVSIAIRCYNEKHVIENIVEAVSTALLGSSGEIIVVDDCPKTGRKLCAL